jgi:hypothetical protein
VHDDGDRAVDALCTAELGAPVARRLFRASSVAEVFGVELADGRGVVVKLLREDPAYLAAVQDVQLALSRGGYPAPRPLFGPRALEGRLAVAEELLDRGAPPDGHEPAARERIATELARLVSLCRPHAGAPELQPAFFTPAPGALWPRPHDVRFDFIGTARGAEWIDVLAAAALAERYDGERVLAHAGWRAEHLRFEGGKLSAVYDWHSLSVAPEPALAGYAAHGFTADWSAEAPPHVPSPDEALAFLHDYEAARGAPFNDAERTSARAALLYAAAYAARCEHSDARLRIGEGAGYRELLEGLAAALA